MSEATLTGLAPTAPEGRELYYFSLDRWLCLVEVIGMLLDPPISPFVEMPADSAISLANALEGSLASGDGRRAAEQLAERMAVGEDEDEEDPIRYRAGWVDSILDDVGELVGFLRTCGGFQAT